MQVEPEWEVMPEAEALVLKLRDLYPDKLAHIDASTIGCAAITNKDQPENKDQDSQIKGITAPMSLFCSKIYIIYFYKNIWDKMTPAQRSVMIMKNLLRVPEQPNGTLIKEDLKDVKCLVRKWGVDYMDNPALPDLTAAKQIF